MFDLPTDTKQMRKVAGKFRNFLLDEGFERSPVFLSMPVIVTEKNHLIPACAESSAISPDMETCKYCTSLINNMRILFDSMIKGEKPQKEKTRISWCYFKMNAWLSTTEIAINSLHNNELPKYLL